MLGSDARVDHTDDDAVAGAVDAADLLPHAAAAVGVGAETEEVGGRLRLRMPDTVGEDAEHVLRGAELVDLFTGQVGAEPVQDDLVLGIRSDPGLPGELALLVAQVRDVLLRVGRGRVELAALLGLGRLQALGVAVVGGERIALEYHDVVAGRALHGHRMRHPLCGEACGGCGSDEQSGQG